MNLFIDFSVAEDNAQVVNLEQEHQTGEDDQENASCKSQLTRFCTR